MIDNQTQEEIWNDWVVKCESLDLCPYSGYNNHRCQITICDCGMEKQGTPEQYAALWEQE